MSDETRPSAPSLRIICMLLASVMFFPALACADGYGFLDGRDVEPVPFEEIEVGEGLVVYFHQRTLGEALVEKDYIVYQFDTATGELRARKAHWREDLPESLPPVRVSAEEAGALVGGTVESARLVIVSPESDIFPLRPVPANPCWVVKSTWRGGGGLTLVDAVDGKVLGEGVPPPAAGFSLTGPINFRPCADTWYAWAQNGAAWFTAMGYPTQLTVWPTQDQVMEQVQSNETLVFYELAHGDFINFSSGCRDGETAEYTTSAEVREWIAGSYKKLFTFIGSCDGQCSSTSNSFSYEFRKGSRSGTATIGYCHMAEPECDVCWDYSLEWQDALFEYMSLGWPIRDAFDQANADYPWCATGNCMRFAGDRTFAITQAAGACCIGAACQVLPTADCVAAGGAWFPGIAGCDPDPCRTYACCLDSACLSLSPFDCTRAGGTLFTELDACTPGICAWGACCLDGELCEYTVAGACSVAQGEWQAGIGCDPNPCLASAVDDPGSVARRPGARLLRAEAIAAAAGGEARIVFEVGGQDPVASAGGTEGLAAASLALVHLTIHDVSGRTIRLLADAPFAPGIYELSWDCRDARGEAVRTGVYFYRLVSGENASVGRVLVIR